MSGGDVIFRQEGAIGHVVFDRPQARNAMTWEMYEQLGDICRQIVANETLRAVVLRGAGGQSFVAGSDIAQFETFVSGDDGIVYERKMEAYLNGLLAIEIPVLAAIEGYAVGGGLNIAACCDIRIATRGSRFGAPIARTIGNTLSINNYARLVAGFGEGRARRMMLLGEMLDAEDALASGFLSRLVAPDEFDATLAKLCERLLGNAPLTLKASKEAIRRVLDKNLAESEDLIARCYGSSDFKTGVAAFIGKQTPHWQGR